MKQLVDIAAILKHETPKAYLVDAGIGDPVWLPKSQVEHYNDGNSDIFTMPEWLAIEKDLI